MIAVIQRCTSANVKIENKIVAEINNGLLLLLGVCKEDEEQDAYYVAKKVASLRIFSDENNKINLSVKDINGSILVVSQFTLCSSIKKGNRPSFLNASSHKIGEKLYNVFVSFIGDFGIPVKTGKFGAIMDVGLVNNGPATFIIDSQSFINQIFIFMLIKKIFGIKHMV